MFLQWTKCYCPQKIKNALFGISGEEFGFFVHFKLRDTEFLVLTWAALCGPTNPWNWQWKTKDKHFSFLLVWEGRERGGEKPRASVN